MDFLSELGIEDESSGAYCGTWLDTGGSTLESLNPSTGARIATVRQATAEDYERCVDAAHEAFVRWREVPAPKRGEIVRQCGEAIREKKDALGRLITLEMGKIDPGGLGRGAGGASTSPTSRSGSRAMLLRPDDARPSGRGTTMREHLAPARRRRRA